LNKDEDNTFLGSTPLDV